MEKFAKIFFRDIINLVLYINHVIMDELVIILQQYWLTPIESKTYLVTLELWSAPASRVASRLNENRVTIYSILENMEKKWFIKSVIKNKIKHYFAISPEELLQIQKEKIDRLMWVMPQLMALWAWSELKPSVALFEWVEWMKFLYQDTIKKEWSEIKAFLGHTNTDNFLQKYLNNEHIKQRKLNNVNAKILMPISMRQEKWYEPNDMKKETLTHTEIRYISDETFSMFNEIDLYDDKIWIMLYGTDEMFWLSIKCKSIYDMLTSLFDLLRKNGSES